ncbi:DNA polymerase epsilon subunit 4 isoform X1 [Aquarana catesbeiana]|uniref:DNA polymerase epsilon subunit 4 isoform X1 n=1 Tax=Aquarana catesbeiana TaxID=8400 RepID=UPI003CCA16A4
MAAEEEAVVLDTTVRRADASEVDLDDRHAGDKAECAAAPVLKLVKLPLSRVKALMKSDPELSLASQESVFLISKATELLIETIAKDAYVYAQRSKRKTLQRRDIDNAVDAFDEFAFLEASKRLTVRRPLASQTRRHLENIE